MATPLRIATFNVENLFSRAKLLNFDDPEQGDDLLALVGRLRAELKKKTYNEAKILEYYDALKSYIEIVEVRGKLFDQSKQHVKAKGIDEWGGFIDFKRAKFSETARANTARVIREINADICCLVEVESRTVLKHFCIERLPKKGMFDDYSHIMLIDGNDPRGIDVAIASRIPIGGMWSHVDDEDEQGSIFSRDCLELEMRHQSGRTIWMILNHLKSQGYGTQAGNDARRLRQAERVAEILESYDLTSDLVVVAGDFNDSIENPPLAPLANIPHLHNIVAEKFSEPRDRATYYYRGRGQQIDYLLVSEPLKDALVDVGIERQGIYGIDKVTKGIVVPFDTVKNYSDSASDHAAVWADFDLDNI
jgi:endonuclease/exonuclease/phosphatase family metal-dependent hydrolase